MSKKHKPSGVLDDMDEKMKSPDDRFLRLEGDGDKALIFFSGEPYYRSVFWNGTQYQKWYAGCVKQLTRRIAINVIVCNIEGDKLQIQGMKVLEQGKRFFKTVKKRDISHGLHDWLFEIERSGDKGDTDTVYRIDAEYELSDKEREKLLSMKLIDLEQLYADLDNGDDDGKKRSKKAKYEDDEEEEDDDEVISAEQRKELVDMFKTLDDPEGEGKKFCGEFGIDKVKNLPKSKFKKALKYIDKLVAGANSGADDDDDDSPF